jgi:dUTP pyrophosphatase
MNFLNNINSVYATSSASSAPFASLPSVINGFQNNTCHKQIMVLNLFVDQHNVLKNTYLNAAHKHNLSLMEDPHFFNAGFDLWLPEDQIFTSDIVNKSNFEVKCSAKIVNISDDNLTSYYTGYYMYPRSSLSKTVLRLANCTGIIDAGYRGPLIGMFDCLTDTYEVLKFTRLLQICAPNLMPIFVRVIDTVEELGPETSRGEGGFGSTGL